MLVRDGTDLSTAELVRLLRCSLGKPTRMIAVPPAILHCLLSLLGRKSMSGRLLSSLAIDDQATRDALEWTPPFSVKEGLKRTTDWYLTMKQNS
jgi:nucleoside-diphosphate-sugar epimerase